MEGIGRVLSLDEGKIELSSGDTLLEIVGENLEITELEKGSVIIKGRITGQNAVSPKK